MNRVWTSPSFGLLGLFTASLLLTAACQLDVKVGQVDGTGGSGGGDPTTGTGSDTTTGAGNPTTGTGNPTTGTGGSEQPCGGELGETCAADEYCDFADDECGTTDIGGVCKKRPTACDAILLPTCSCGGQIYDNACDAAVNGKDVSNLGCAPSAGEFACGWRFCNAATEFCYREEFDVIELPDAYACKPIPPECSGVSSCACLDNIECNDACGPSKDGDGLVVTCYVGG